MKTLRISALIFLSFCALSACKQASADAVESKSETKEIASANTKTASFKIEGMNCAVMCASKIEKELKQTNGVSSAKVDFEKKTATVQYDNTMVTPTELVKKVESIADGKTYKVSELKSSDDKAYRFGEEPKKVKKTRKQRKQEKLDAAKAAATPTPSCATETQKKPGCCAAKKSCSSSSTGGTL